MRTPQYEALREGNYREGGKVAEVGQVYDDVPEALVEDLVARHCVRVISGPPEQQEATVDELRQRARELDISGRSSMDKDQLAAAIAEAEEEVSGDA